MIDVHTKGGVYMLKRLDARIPEELLVEIKKVAKEEGISVTEIIIDCFRLYLSVRDATSRKTIP